MLFRVAWLSVTASQSCGICTMTCLICCLNRYHKCDINCMSKSLAFHAHVVPYQHLGCGTISFCCVAVWVNDILVYRVILPCMSRVYYMFMCYMPMVSDIYVHIRVLHYGRFYPYNPRIPYLQDSGRVIQIPISYAQVSLASMCDLSIVAILFSLSFSVCTVWPHRLI